MDLRRTERPVHRRDANTADSARPAVLHDMPDANVTGWDYGTVYHLPVYVPPKDTTEIPDDSYDVPGINS
jgi:hypothetical protein